MEKTIEKIGSLPRMAKRKRVGAYARVSVDKEAMLHSLAAQTDYYRRLISGHPDWELVDVYADYGISGTFAKRPQFQRMVEDAKAGRLDLVITKSISRFARNTAVLLETVRLLKGLGVDVYFEEQNLHSLSGDGELIMSLLAGFAQEESRSVSENVRWTVLKSFREGIPYGAAHRYGYDVVGKKFVVNREEAEVVKRIFAMALDGYGYYRIANTLNGNGTGKDWSVSTIGEILHNEIYKGDLVLQKTFRPKPYQKKRNKGELAKYVVEDDHEAIVPREVFDAVQERISGRAEIYKAHADSPENDLFRGMVFCGSCGKTYVRKRRYGYDSYSWRCGRFSKHLEGGQCHSPTIPDEVLVEKTMGVLGVAALSEELIQEAIERITVRPDRTLEYRLKDGETLTVGWDYKSRKHSWTPEMREKARRRAVEQHERERREAKCR